MSHGAPRDDLVDDGNAPVTLTTLDDDFGGATGAIVDRQEPCPTCATPMRVLFLAYEGFWGVRVIAHSFGKQRCSGSEQTLRKGKVS